MRPVRRPGQLADGVGASHPAVKGVRVTPNVYTTPAEIDVFIAAVEKVVRDGLPAA